MYGDDKKILKNKLLIELELDTGVQLTGHVFVGQQQRLSDLMNDEREYLPFEHMDGAITIFLKRMMRSVKPITRAQAQGAPTENPYAILGVAENASDAAVREAYHRRVQETHPDRLASMGLAPEFVRFAHDRMTRINDAYNRIKAQRRATRETV
jgi:DnaJ-domain-containing protein 1